jgi:hypothetical protein
MIQEEDVAQNGQEVSERVEVETEIIGQPRTPILLFWNARRLHLLTRPFYLSNY